MSLLVSPTEQNDVPHRVNDEMPAFQRRAPTANPLRCRNQPGWYFEPRRNPRRKYRAPAYSTHVSGAYFRRQGRSGCGDGPNRLNAQLFRGHWVNGLGSPARISPNAWPPARPAGQATRNWRGCRIPPTKMKKMPAFQRWAPSANSLRCRNRPGWYLESSKESSKEMPGHPETRPLIPARISAGKGDLGAGMVRSV